MSQVLVQARDAEALVCRCTSLQAQSLHLHTVTHHTLVDVRALSLRPGTEVCCQDAKDYKRAKHQREMNSNRITATHTQRKSEHTGVINNTYQVVLHTAVGIDGPCTEPVRQADSKTHDRKELLARITQRCINKDIHTELAAKAQERTCTHAHANTQAAHRSEHKSAHSLRPLARSQPWSDGKA